MNYFLKQKGKIVSGSPFTVDQINEQIQRGILNSEILATADLGEPVDQIENAPDGDWIYLSEIPGVMGVGKQLHHDSIPHSKSWMRSFFQTILLGGGIIGLILSLFFSWYVWMMRGFAEDIGQVVIFCVGVPMICLIATLIGLFWIKSN